ncbi:MAG: RagB/SusD family nutrient uptake outer membrane protein [Candidatus Marinimicrobia bacterium]|nr:RagB/SusD family nutrient uptake outer membrane protein [Candidatus Neomarinimicrobiota bacterium]MBL7047658.1 RagB/SusD family nutrient uptake outer membrane protein [Candidatus Neomarinimicrobiota bacterium]
MNTIRKNTFLKILPMVAVLFWVGCEDLDFPDPNNPTDETATIQSLVTGAESAMRQDLGVYLRDLLVVGREAYYLEPADPRYTGELLTGPIDPGGFLCYRPWQTAYKVIANCETILASSDADAGATGVAKTLEAYSLMRLVYLWDDSGARLNYDGDINADVATKAEVIAEIETLLDGGHSDLQSAGSSFSFSLSSGFDGFDSPATFATFNRGLRARVAVHQDDWSTAQTALDACSDWASGDANDGVYHAFSSGANDQDNEMYEDPTATTIKLMVHPSFYTDADSGDTRLADNVVVRSDTITYDDLESYLAPNLYSSSYDPVPIMRAVELQLLQAEVHIGNADYSSAETILNSIREAAGVTAYSGTDASNAVDRVLHEKRYSLFLEGHRLVDMRHYDKTDELPIDRPERGDSIVTFPIPETETPG